MYYFTFLLLVCLTFFQAKGTSIEIGELLPDHKFARVDQPETPFNTADARGQVLVIEFWATWCAPCLSSMAHLEELQQQFGDRLQVVAVSYEKMDRIERFVRAKGFDFQFVHDEQEQLREWFPHRVLPHTIVVDPSGKVAAITSPKEVRASAIQALLDGKTIQLDRKVENLDFDYGADYFDLDTSTQNSFQLQPNAPGVSSFSRHYPNGPFKNRRLSFINFTIDALYKDAYQTSIRRIVYEVDESEFDYEIPENRYCLDMVVAPEATDQLHAQLRQQLNASFDVKARVEKQPLELVVVYRVDSLPLNLPPEDSAISMMARGDLYRIGSATVADFAEYLEGFGIVGKAVVDETGIAGAYSWNFSFDPENPQTFFDELKAMGLGVKKATREVEVVVLSR